MQYASDLYCRESLINGSKDKLLWLDALKDGFSHVSKSGNFATAVIGLVMVRTEQSTNHLVFFRVDLTPVIGFFFDVTRLK